MVKLAVREMPAPPPALPVLMPSLSCQTAISPDELAILYHDFAALATGQTSLPGKHFPSLPGMRLRRNSLSEKGMLICSQK
jgi:hypothetical protein